VAAVIVLVAPDTLRGNTADLAPTCLTSEGKTACGHHCMSGFGQVRCAQTPEGLCSAGSGTVACWDPPPLLKAVYPIRVPRPQCLASAGQIACGYHCLSNYDRVLCAQTPFGACGANEGHLVCWDPPGQILASQVERARAPTCMANYGDVACGYGCVANYGVVRCAKTPSGFCRAEHDQVFCWDPPLVASFGFAFDPASEMGCLSSSGGSSCGYACLATARASQCAKQRDQVCRAKDDGVECFDPAMP
jgi:hypothetical protein